MTAATLEYRPGMSIRDYLEWARIYPHTKEAFELTKECGEIELLGMYIESHHYMQENNEFLESKGYTPALACMMESVGSDIDALQVTFTEKVEGVLGKILRFLTAPFRALGRFLRWLFGKSEDTDKKIEAAAATATETVQNATPEQIATLEGNLPQLFQTLRENVTKYMEEADADAEIQRVIRLIAGFEQQADKEHLLQFMNRASKEAGSERKVFVPKIVANSKEICIKVRHAIRNLRRSLDGSLDHAAVDPNVTFDTVRSMLSVSKDAVTLRVAEIGERIQALEETATEVQKDIDAIIQKLDGSTGALIAKRDQHQSFKMTGTSPTAQRAEAGLIDTGNMIGQLRTFITEFQQLTVQATTLMQSKETKWNDIKMEMNTFLTGVIASINPAAAGAEAPPDGAPVSPPATPPPAPPAPTPAPASTPAPAPPPVSPPAFGAPGGPG